MNLVFRRLALGIVFFFGIVGVSKIGLAASDDDYNASKSFVQEVANEIISLLSHKEKGQQKQEDEFRKILEKYFSLDDISKFTLGRYWRVATDDEKKEYRSLFESVVVETYASQFDEYANEKITVKDAYTLSDGGIVVRSIISGSTNGREPLKVDWKVYHLEGQYLVYDIVVNGASMSVTQRNEYASVIRRSGGKISGLLKEMQQKVDSENTKQKARSAP